MIKAISIKPLDQNVSTGQAVVFSCWISWKEVGKSCIPVYEYCLICGFDRAVDNFYTLGGHNGSECHIL